MECKRQLMRFWILILLAAHPILGQSEARRWYDKGRAAYLKFTEDGYRDAIRHFEKALKADPMMSEAHAGLAEALTLAAMERTKRAQPTDEYFTKAAAEASEAVRLDSASAHAYRASAHLLFVRDGETRNQQTYDLLTRALSCDSADAESWYILAMLTDNQNPQGLLRRALRINSDLYVVQYALGLAHAGKQEWDSALAYYQKCVQLVEANYLAHYAMGIVHSRKKQYLTAIPHYERAQRLDVPGNDIHLYLGLAYYYTDANKKARKELRAYVDAEPTSPHRTQILDILKEIE